MSVDYSNLPEHMQDAARLYVEHGIEPGSFLMALLTNNLAESFMLADDINSECLAAWVNWLYFECPAAAWGSREDVAKWIDRHEAAREQQGQLSTAERRLMSAEERADFESRR